MTLKKSNAMNTFTILLNVLGIAIFYIFRYKNRTVKNEFSLKFWIKENAPELLATLLINFALLLLLLHPSTDPTEYLLNLLPKGLIVVGKPAMALAIGVYFAWMLFGVINEKLK